MAYDGLTNKHTISEHWEKSHQIFTSDETKNLDSTLKKSILLLKQNYLKNMKLLKTSNFGLDWTKLLIQFASSQ